MYLGTTQLYFCLSVYAQAENLSEDKIAGLSIFFLFDDHTTNVISSVLKNPQKINPIDLGANCFMYTL